MRLPVRVNRGGPAGPAVAAWVSLATCLASLSAFPSPAQAAAPPAPTTATATPAGSPSTVQSPAKAAQRPATAVQDSATGHATATATPEVRLAVWNHDVELGRDDAAPTNWSTSPATPGATLRAVRKSAPSPFPRYTGEKTINHVAWVNDRTRSGGAAARTGAINAVPGRTYATYAQVYVGSGTSARLNLEFLDASGRRLRLIDQSNNTPKPGTLTWVKATGVAPAGTVTVRPMVVSSYAAVGSSYWDLVYAAEIAVAETYAPTLGTGPVLFVGAHRIESTTNLTRIVHPGQKYRESGDGRLATPVLDAVCCTRNGQPPHSAQLFGSVLYEDGVYKMWYTAKASGQPWSVRYAESADGDTFPHGTQVLADVWAGGVVRNPSSADPSRRYLMLGVKGTMPTVTAVPMPAVDVTYRAYASPDGRTWTPLSSSPVLPMRDIAYVGYDDVKGRFVASTKQASGSGRQSYVSYSTDFVRWTTPRQAIWADGADPANTSVYGSPMFRYGDQVLGIPLLYTQAVVNGVNGPVVPQIASSADGTYWSRLSRSPLVPLGNSGQPDDGFLLAASAPVVAGNQIRLYYSGWDAGHEVANRNSRIFYAQWRRDGFASLRAGSTAATLTTKPLLPTGGNLTVNADLGAGQLRAELLDATTNAVIPGYAAADSTVVSGDTLTGAITWGGKTVGTLESRRIKIRFSISAGDFYSFRVS